VIVGVAIDDNQSVIDYIDPMGIEYPVLIGDQEGIYITKDYGNRLGVLPYTVVIDRKGKIVYRHRSEITYTEAEQIIRPLL
jgi:peroxiredoxin